MTEVLPQDARVSPDGHLVVGGCDATELVERFGTPLIVFDRATFEARAGAFASEIGAQHVYYGAKAFCCVAVCELAKELGLAIDVCTEGELATALAAGFPPERILFHGNNKSMRELEAARDAGVGRIVIDAFEEIERVKKADVRARLLVRVTPGVEAHTHEFVKTGKEDSKFGFTLAGGVAQEAVARALEVPGCEVVGLHAHIGSQIFEMAGFDVATERLIEFSHHLRESLGHVVKELNLGGGFGIAYTPDDDPLEPAAMALRVRDDVAAGFGQRGLEVPAVALEPGRALAGPAAVTLYRVGIVKAIAGVRTYVSVDGGMSDNIRPGLYGARYKAVLANRMNDTATTPFTVAGKHCEPDILIEEVRLPADVAPGDLLCLPATGAYTYSMASNYNRVPRPAVVMVKDGKAVEIIRRETVADLLALDRRLDGSRGAAT